MRTKVKGIATATFIAVLLMVGNAKATELKANSIKSIETEQKLQIETWMTNETVWNTSALNSMDFAVETETEIELESWMTNTELWNTNKVFEQELESELLVEIWMTNDKTWNTVNNDVETALTVEHWMVNDNFWK